MKTTLALLAASLLLAACATPEASLTGASRAATGSGTHYCWKERLDADGASLVCNWEASPADACASNAVVSIAKASVTRGPENARRCENGQWLVVVTTK